MRSRRRGHYSGIGGQAVLEGVMMKNKSRYAVAVRKPNDEIVVEIEGYQGLVKEESLWRKIPFIRGIFNFVESLILGNHALNASAAFCKSRGMPIWRANPLPEPQGTMPNATGELMSADAVSLIVPSPPMAITP